MAMAEETESKGIAELSDMSNNRKEIHLKKGTDTSDIFGYQDAAMNDTSTKEPDQAALAGNTSGYSSSQAWNLAVYTEPLDRQDL